MLKRDIEDLPPVSQLFQRQQQSRMLAPAPEGHPCFAMKHPVKGFFRNAKRLSPVRDGMGLIRRCHDGVT